MKIIPGAVTIEGSGHGYGKADKLGLGRGAGFDIHEYDEEPTCLIGESVDTGPWWSDTPIALLPFACSIGTVDFQIARSTRLLRCR